MLRKKYLSPQSRNIRIETEVLLCQSGDRARQFFFVNNEEMKSGDAESNGREESGIW